MTSQGRSEIFEASVINEIGLKGCTLQFHRSWRSRQLSCVYLFSLFLQDRKIEMWKLFYFLTSRISIFSKWKWLSICKDLPVWALFLYCQQISMQLLLIQLFYQTEAWQYQQKWSMKHIFSSVWHWRKRNYITQRQHINMHIYIFIQHINMHMYIYLYILYIYLYIYIMT